MMFALAFQARVYVTSGSASKLKKAMEMGRQGGYNIRNRTGWKKRTKDVAVLM